jgi:hypothetical protein
LPPYDPYILSSHPRPQVVCVYDYVREDLKIVSQLVCKAPTLTEYCHSIDSALTRKNCAIIDGVDSVIQLTHPLTVGLVASTSDVNTLQRYHANTGWTTSLQHESYDLKTAFIDNPALFEMVAAHFSKDCVVNIIKVRERPSEPEITYITIRNDNTSRLYIDTLIDKLKRQLISCKDPSIKYYYPEPVERYGLMGKLMGEILKYNWKSDICTDGANRNYLKLTLLVATQ